MKNFDARILWSFLSLAGFIIYLVINYQVTGNFLAFMEIQREHWCETFDPLLGLERAWHWAIDASFPDNLMLGVAQLAFAALGLLGIIIGFIRRLAFHTTRTCFCLGHECVDELVDKYSTLHACSFPAFHYSRRFWPQKSV